MKFKQYHLEYCQRTKIKTHLMRDVHTAIACVEKCKNLQRKIREELDNRFALFIDHVSVLFN